MSDIVNVPMAAQRDIQTVTAEIRQLHRQAQCMVLGYAIEIGRKLVEAKAMLPYGQWGQWLKEEVEFSQSSAQNFMRIFEEYGAKQVSLFGDAESQTLGNLPLYPRPEAAGPAGGGAGRVCSGASCGGHLQPGTREAAAGTGRGPGRRQECQGRP